MTHIRCNTIRWLSRRSIGQLIITFASPSLPLIVLMWIMDCGARSEVGVGVVCSLVEMGLMLCGAMIGVLTAFEIYRERKQNDKERDGQSNEPGPSIPKGGSELAGEDMKRSSPIGQNSKNIMMAKTCKKRTRAFALIVIIITGVVAVLDTDTWVPQSTQTSDSVSLDALFLSSATIVAFAMFGSALTRLSRNKDLIESILLAIIVVVATQVVFMLSLVSNFNMPKVSWGVITATALFWLLYVVFASRTQPNEEEDARPAR